MKVSIGICAAVLGAAFGAAPAAAQQWEQIGYQQADSKKDTDVVAVKGNDRHKKIRLCVEQRPLRMRDLDVVFANGGKQDVRVRKLIAAGSCTRAIDLKGNKRNIAKVVMTYDKLGDGKPAIVKVYAR